MQHDIEYERYKDWDFSNAKPANKHPLVKKLQDNVKTKQQAFDDDVTNWVVKQDTVTKEYINNMIRTFMNSKLVG